MEVVKPWYLSRAIWGAIISLISSGVMLTGHTVAPEIQSALVDLLTQSGTLLGSALALYGRFSATSKIG